MTLRNGDNLAVLYNDWSMSVRTPDGQAHEMSGKAIEVVCRQGDGSWKFAVDDPFARIDGFKNAVSIHGVMNGTPMDLFLAGPGAGADETASRVLGNLNHLLDELRRGERGAAAP